MQTTIDYYVILLDLRKMRDNYISQGFSKREAIEKALTDMFELIDRLPTNMFKAIIEDYKLAEDELRNE